jgi:anti-sigma-K factor RskA
MDTPDVHTLVGAFALDALDDDERAAFERHLAECEPCRDDVAGLRRTAVRLADAAAVAPPPRVRARVLQEIGVTRQARDTADGAGRSRRPERRGPGGGGSRLWLAAAAVLAVIAVGAGALAWSQYRAAQDARATAQAITAVVADPSARRVATTLPGGGSASLVVAGGRAVLAGDALPALAEDRTYQLWIVRGQQISSAGLGPPGPEGGGTWSRLVEGVRPGDVVAVSVEPRGGSKQPTTTPIATLKV